MNIDLYIIKKYYENLPNKLEWFKATSTLNLMEKNE
tara:strand:+ start:87 stop:194 length:108 start_codon:yes stop_codon:yes gene_type:complete